MNKIKDQKNLYTNVKTSIGVLGGTFDPPHSAHIHMAKTAKSKLNLDKVIFMPCGMPPHKKPIEISNSIHRTKMLELMLCDYNDFYIDAYELMNPMPSYTLDSIKRIDILMPESSKMYFIIGADSLMYLEKWHEARKLFKITNFAVIPRCGYTKEECMNKIKLLKSEFNTKIIYLDSDTMDLSSTAIRESFKNDQNIYNIEEKVAKYIKDNELYK